MHDGSSKYGNGSARGRGHRHQHNVEEEVRTSISRYQRLIMLEVQDWLNHINVNAKEAQEQDEKERVEAARTTSVLTLALHTLNISNSWMCIDKQISSWGLLCRRPLV